MVLTRPEVAAVLARMDGRYRLMASLLYGTGMRLMECVRLRVKDIDFAMRQITVRDGKGGKDRITMLPQRLIAPLQFELERTRELHEADLASGTGAVHLPFALERKYPRANRELGWQYVFPARAQPQDPRDGVLRRHHVDPKALQRAVLSPLDRAI